MKNTEKYIQDLIAEWDDVYKKGQLSLWVLLSIYDGKKYAAEISEFMYHATNGTFEVKEQSLYRALRRFVGMELVRVTEEESPNAGPKRKFYELTEVGVAVLAEFINLHIEPLFDPSIKSMLDKIQQKGTS